MARFSRRGGELRVQLVAESAEVASALSRELPRLGSTLARDGGHVQVEVQVGGGAAQHHGAGGSHDPALMAGTDGDGRGSRARRGHESLSAEPGAPARETSYGPAAPRARVSTSTLDLLG
jgi:hypothetical protein